MPSKQQWLAGSRSVGRQGEKAPHLVWLKIRTDAQTSHCTGSNRVDTSQTPAELLRLLQAVVIQDLMGGARAPGDLVGESSHPQGTGSLSPQ